MARRDDFAGLGDYELAVRSCRIAAEVARLEAEELHALGFRLVCVVGSPALFWRRDGVLFTHDYALAAIRAIPEDKEDSQ